MRQAGRRSSEKMERKLRENGEEIESEREIGDKIDLRNYSCSKPLVRKPYNMCQPGLQEF